MKYYKFITIIILFLLLGQAFAETEVEGDVEGVWTVRHSPYIVIDDIRVPDHSELTIDPGVEVLFSGAYMMLVNGWFSAVGNEDNLITFSSLEEDETWRSIRFINADDGCEISYCIIENSERPDNWPEVDGRGGAVYGINCDDFVVTNSVFRNNFTNGIGSAVCFFSCTGNIANNYIHNNYSLGSSVWLEGSNMPFTGNIVEDNLGDYNSGVYVADSSPLIADNIIRFNDPGDRVAYGTALYFINSHSRVFNNLIYGNIHGGIYCGTGTRITDFDHNIIFSNPDGPPITLFSNSQIELNNSVVWGHDEEVLISGGGCSIEAQYTVFENYEGQPIDGRDGMIDENPHFLDPDDNNFQLADNSPCIDAGDPDSPADPDESRTDIGLYFGEFNHGGGGGNDDDPIEVSGTWTIDESPIIIDSDIVVPNRRELIIEPGVEVLFDGPYSFTINGLLTAIGEEDNMILFTSRDENETWRSIRLIDSHPDCEISYCIIENSEVTERYPHVASRGGGLYAENCENLSINNTVFRHNSSTGEGGAACYYNCTGEFVNNRVQNNLGFTEIVWFENSDMPILNNMIEHNEGEHGAGVMVSGSSQPVAGNTFCHNESTTMRWGSSLYFERGSRSQVYNNLIYENISGAVYFGVNCNISTFEHNVIFNNTHGPAITLYQNSSVSINNSVIWGHNDAVWLLEGSSASAQYSVLEGYRGEGINAGEGMIDSDPGFVDPDGGDFHLTEDSPCIDAGDPDSPNDPDESRADIGLYFGDFIPGDPDDPPAPHFEHHQTDANHSLLIEMAMFEEEELVEYDEIGVFTPDGICAGAVTISDEGFEVGLVAWRANDEFAYFEVGDPFSFQVWKWEAGEEYEAEANFTHGENSFEADGFSVLTLESFLPEDPDDPPAPHFEYQETNANHSILVLEALFDDEPLVEFDEIGVFTPGGVCAGAAVVEEGEERIGLAAFLADGDIEGFNEGDAFSFKFWKWEEEAEYNTEAEIVDGDETFQRDGFTLVTLSGHQPHHPFEFVETATSHSILILDAIVDGEQIPSGDAFGIFTPEGLCVGAEIWEGEAVGIAAWADDEATEELDGFRDGEAFTFKRWDRELDEVTELDYNVTDGDRNFRNDGFSAGTLGELSIIEKTISINEGWNIISFNIEPSTVDVVELFEPLTEGEDPILIMLKNQSGQFYRPSVGFSNIEGWVYSEAYQVKVTQNSEVTVEGTYIEPNRPLPVTEGWQLVAYYPDWELPAVDAFESIADNARIIKNSSGQFYMPEREFNNIQACLPGQGFRLKMYQDDNLVYPPDEPEAEALLPRVERRHFVNPKSTTNNMSLLLESENLPTGIEIAAFRSDGLLVGSGVLNQDGRCGIALWGDDEHTDAVDGLRTGEIPYFKVWNGHEEVNVELTMIEGQLDFATDGFAIGEISAEGIITPTRYTLSEPYPNPFNDRSQITFSLPVAKDVRMDLLDVSGRLVSTLLNESMPTGYHTVPIYAKGLSSGVYLVRLTAGSRQMTKRVVLMR